MANPSASERPEPAEPEPGATEPAEPSEPRPVASDREPNLQTPAAGAASGGGAQPPASGKQAPWSAQLTPDRLEIRHHESGRLFTLTPSEVGERARLNSFVRGGALLQIELEHRVGVHLSREDTAALRTWMGDHFSQLMASSARSGWLWALVIGATFALPFGQELPIPSIVAGAAFIAGALSARFRPTAVSWALLAIGWLVFVGTVVYQAVITREVTWWLPLLVVIGLFAALRNIRLYRFFA